MRLQVEDARKRLALVWVGGALLSVATLLAQTVGERHGDSVGKVWSWLTAALSPALALVLTMVRAEALGHRARGAAVDPFYYRLTLFLSLFYLAAVALVLWLPWQSTRFLEHANYFIAVVQSMVVATVGVFFARGEGQARERAGG